MYGVPEKVNLKMLLDVFNSFDLSVCGVTGMWGRSSLEGRKRKLLSAKPGLVTNSQKYVEHCVEMCRSLEASELNVCLFADDGLHLRSKPFCDSRTTEGVSYAEDYTNAG